MNRSGFTLIELLVVIAIIGLLASVVLSAVGTARSKGQDAARISNVKQLENALELYYADHGGFPTSNGATYGNPNGDVPLQDPLILAALTPKYIGTMPAQLITDGDRYYGNGVTSGTTKHYGLKIYISSGWCKTADPGTDAGATGWWGAIPACNF